ncbi:MAG: DUF4124 domain-containing protein [Thiolinea sp.]
MRVLLLTFLLLITAAAQAEVFQWRDANGSVVYGDSPPESVTAREVELQPLTIADRYDTGEDDNKAAATNTDAEAEQDDEQMAETVNYSRFAVQSPEANEALRSNNGNVLIRLELQPDLQAGHGIAVYMDGKQIANGKATVFSLENVDRGQHSLFAVLYDAEENMIRNTEAVSFTVLRASRI